MKKLLKQLLSRTFLMVLAILAQVAVLILMILEFSSYFVGFYAVCTLGSLVAVLWIVNSERNPAYKLAFFCCSAPTNRTEKSGAASRFPGRTTAAI